MFIGLRKNTTIRSAYIDRISQIFDLKVAEDIFTPKVRVDGTVLRSSTGGVTTDSGDVAVGVAALTPIGTTFNFVWDHNVSRSPGQGAYGSSLIGTFAQPLLKGAGLEVNMASVRAARLAENINLLTLRATVATTVTDIITAYRALLNSQDC